MGVAGRMEREVFDGAGGGGSLIVVGLGNPILSDDGVGLRVLGLLRESEPVDVALEQNSHGGLRLMEQLLGHKRAIIVDAIRTGAPPGSLFELALNDLPSLHSGSSHDATLQTALEVGRSAGAALPENEAIRLVAIEAADTTTFAEQCTPAVEAAIPRAARHVLQLIATIDSWSPPGGRVEPVP